MVLLGTAAYFWWTESSEIAFVTGVAGAVSFFLSVRVGSKERVDSRIQERRELEERESLMMTEDIEFVEEKELVNSLRNDN